MKTFNIVLSGVGGQGVILASKILSSAAIESGLDVKQSEVHGMSQRGGSVTSHVRIGSKVYSPLVVEGEADIVLGFELLEAERNKHWVKKDGIIIYNKLKVNPITVSAGMAEYPENIEDEMNKLECKVYCVDAFELAKNAGNPKAANVALVGAGSNFIPIEPEIWEKVLTKVVPPKVLDVNISAFNAGRNCIQI
jgi:indolepyruvate ferredoxin oxidoreductase beta subunit